MKPYFSKNLCLPNLPVNGGLEFSGIFDTQTNFELKDFFLKFGIIKIYAAENREVAANLLFEQIKPFLKKDEKYAVVFPTDYKEEVKAECTLTTQNFVVLVFGLNRNVGAAALDLSFVKNYCAKLREWHQKHISGISINSTTFDTFSDDYSETSQFAALCSLKAITPYPTFNDCF